MLAIFRTYMCAAILICGIFFPLSGTAQVATSVYIPGDLVGTYTVRMVDRSSISPIPAGTETTVTITAGGTLCTQGLVLTSPAVRGVFGSVVWDVQEVDLSFVLDIHDDAFEDLTLLSLVGSSYGRLEFVNNLPSEECGASTDLNNVNDFFDTVEDAFGDIFPGGPFTFNQIGNGFGVFRFYQKTGVYLAIRDGVAYARGGDYGDELIQVGDVGDIIDDFNTLFRPDQIASFYHGTYQLTLTETQPFSPLEDSTELTFVIAPSGRMCVGEFVLSASVINGAQSAVWSSPNSDLRYVLDLTRDDGLNAEEYRTEFAVGVITYQTADGTYYGSFEGDKVSLSTECGDANGGNADLASINELFALAEQQYPALFPLGPQTYNQKNDGYVYRYYYDSGIFIGVKDGLVYLNGGQFGNNVEPTSIGTLAAILVQLNDTPSAVTIPSSQVGTYAMTFSGATSFSPSAFADGKGASVVITASGGLCMDGVELATAVSKPARPGLAFWENANVGLSLSLDLNDLSTTDLSLEVNALDGLAYSSLAGDKISLASVCGANAVVTDIDLANQLFGLAEQYYPELFPASTLSFNQISGNAVKRNYEEKKTSIVIEGESVSVKGGEFGESTQVVGTLSKLIDEIVTANIPPPGAMPIYDMFVKGTSQTRFGNLATKKGRYDSRKYAIERPDSGSDAALKAAVALAISDAVRKVDSSTVSVFSDTAEALILTATVSSDSITGDIGKNFQLLITIQKRL